ncbi:MAG: prephenate dehydrogenase/arogenate dehydrogenase family protein [Clostridia bacterium]|nr:prephenate dehydrogenase/arogenate dehydrogenase family protein [Clostridia bacterium]
MKVGVVALGLIGASFAKAVKAYTPHTVFGENRSQSVLEFALMTDTIDGRLDETTLPECELIFLASYPDACLAWLEKHAREIRPGAVVLDGCGVKQVICEKGFAIAQKHGFTFVGGHPMAGYHKSGIKYARETLFKGASMIVVPPDARDVDLLARLTDFFKSIGFGSVTVTDAVTHDRNIAFTSQLAHVVSNAYVKSPRAIVHKGFSAGSYKDLTRVAYLNETMWTELFLDNKDFLKEEIDHLIGELRKYSDALAAGDAPALEALLRDGRERKERIDS